MQGSLRVQVEHKKTKVKDLAKSKFSKAVMRHLFLYESAVIVCKKCPISDGVENKSGLTRSASKSKTTWGNKTSEKLYSYEFKRCVKVYNVKEVLISQKMIILYIIF